MPWGRFWQADVLGPLRHLPAALGIIMQTVGKLHSPLASHFHTWARANLLHETCPPPTQMMGSQWALTS